MSSDLGGVLPADFTKAPIQRSPGEINLESGSHFSRDSVLFTVFWGNRFSRDFHWLPHKICPYSEMETRIPPHSQPPMTRVWTRQPVTCKPPSQPPRTAPSSLWPWHSPAVLGQILRDNSTQGTAGWLPIRPTLSKRLLKLLGVECPSPCSLLLYSLLM